MSTDFTKSAPPTEMPASEVQRIKDLKCPPPFRPSQANAKITALNNAIKAQMSAIQILEKQIIDLEKRYKITFTCDNAPTFFSTTQSEPVSSNVSLTGTVTNVNISMQLIPAEDGIDGLPGDQGPQGQSGNSVLPGIAGSVGYYGMRGDITK